jgi:quercetin dioxygenase-like cupin family protein
MPQPGQTVENPVTGERITFVTTAAQTGGERVEINLALKPHGAVPGAHVHPEQYETFRVISGTMKFRLGFKKIIAGPGETVVVPPGAVHSFANAGEDEALVRVVVEPALDMEQLFATTVALAQEGNTNRKGMPNPVHLALFVERFKREVQAPFPPPSVVRLLLAPLRAYGRRRGLAERYGIAPRRAPRGGEALPA